MVGLLLLLHTVDTRYKQLILRLNDNMGDFTCEIECSILIVEDSIYRHPIDLQLGNKQHRSRM